MHKLALIFSHPTQFEAPLFRKLTQIGHPPIKVFFWNTDQSSNLIDPELGHTPGWDIPLNSGYDYELIPQKATWSFLRRNIFENPQFEAVLISGYSERAAQMSLLQGFIFGKPVVIRSDSTSLYHRRFLKQLFRKPALFILFSLASAFMATGTLAKEHLMELGAPQESIFLLPYSVNNEMMIDSSTRFRREREKLRSELGLKDDDVVLLAVIKFIEREGIMDLLQAFSAIKDNPHVRLIVVGDGPLRDQVNRFIEAHGLSAVLLMGYQPYSQLPKYYALSDLFIHPATNEPWGVSVNEAMCCGLPVIVSDLTGSSKDLVHDGKNGFVYIGGSPASLRLAISRFLERYEQRNKMGSTSLEIVNNWGYDRCVSEIQRMFAFIDRQV